MAFTHVKPVVDVLEWIRNLYPPRTDGLFVTRYHHTGSPKTWRGGSTIKLNPVISEHLLSCTVPSQKLMTDWTFLQRISLSFQYDVLSLDG